MISPEVQREHTRAALPSPRRAAHFIRCEHNRKVKDAAAMMDLMVLVDTFGIEHTRLESKRRTADYVADRALACRFLRKRGHGYLAIGRVMGNRDHSSIVWLVNKGL